MSVPQYPFDPTGDVSGGGPTAPGGLTAPLQPKVPGGPTSKNIWGILALIGGIAGIVLAWVLLGGAFGIAGLIFGIVGLSAVKKGTASNKGLNVWGIILSAVAILLAGIFLIVYVVIGALAANEAQQSIDSISESVPSDSAPGDPADPDSELQSDEPLPVTGGEFPIGPDLTMALTVRPEQLEEPTGYGGEEPDQGDYESAWDEAVETDGQIIVVTATIRNSGETLDTNNGTIALMSQSGEKEYPTTSTPDYPLNIFTMGGLTGGEEKTIEAAFAVPASELDSVMVRVILQLDMGEGRQFDIG